MARIAPIALLAAAIIAGVVYLRTDHRPTHYTGFVEGEERIVRSEVSGRVNEVRFAEGESVPPGAVIAVLSAKGIAARIKSKEEEIAALGAEVRAQEEQIALTEAVWERDVSARRAELKQTEAAYDLAQRTLEREQTLVKSGASTVQSLDDNRSRRDQAASAQERAKQMLARAEAEERQISLGRKMLESLRSRRDLAAAQLEELRVEQAKFEIHAPAVPTTVQTQLIWPGELAQPGSPILALLDPKDKYVQFYIPVGDLGRFRVGQKVDIELDSEQGKRIAGEVSFIAESASFTPEKIETREDRMGQVYRAKVRILEQVERLKPGTEGNIYLSADDHNQSATDQSHQP